MTSLANRAGRGIISSAKPYVSQIFYFCNIPQTSYGNGQTSPLFANVAEYLRRKVWRPSKERAFLFGERQRMKTYKHDPKKHQPPSDYIVKTCVDCSCQFSCPGNWRKTVRCPDCANDYKKHAGKLRREGRKTMDESSKNKVCERCGSDYLVQVHHKKPIVKGGDSSDANLEYLCIYCHMQAHEGLLDR